MSPRSEHALSCEVDRSATTDLQPLKAAWLHSRPELPLPIEDARASRAGDAPRSARRAALAHVIALLPTVLMWFFCVVLRAAIPAVFAFHACMLLSMLAFCALYRLDPWGLVPTRADVRRNLAACRLSFVSISVGSIAIYLGCRSGSAPGEYLGVPLSTLRALIELFGIHEPPLPYAFFGLYFTLANPLLEEVFWRTFLHNELGAERPWAKALLAHDFALYHLFITSSLMPHWFSFCCAYPFLVGFGLALDRIARDERFGIVTAIGVHAGMDLAAAFWILDLRFGWLDILQRA
ncbi:hypothetical protein KFE25_009072 [Diacronema lutheri]|uniref:CAAX prenyl protease 2/Lysostaphin resistance protein A-like domain-containing protein n=2 Tax=Diacronema lutheri TaxID=2081491 RepID=A0A8J5XK01_DIALT|nr:hypothetical protein KFE25_009072 [Diacronema lutheri]